MSVLFILFPYVLLIFLCLTFRENNSGEPASLPIRDALVIASIIYLGSILTGTELLGLFHAIAFTPLILFYSFLGGIIALCLYIRNKKRHSFDTHITLPKDFSFLFFLGITLLLIGAAGIIAFVCPPNNPDSLSYHLGRQIYWIQQKSLEHFHASDNRMLMFPPLSEIIGMHFIILSGGETWANFPQFFSYFSGAIVASLIARELGAGRFGQVTASLLFVTIPMAWHQASNSKNDLMVGMLLCVLAWDGLKYVKLEKSGVLSWIFTGITLGLIWMVKGTGLFYSVPVMIFIGVVAFRKMGSRVIQPIIIVSIVSFALCFGHYFRNYKYYGSVFGSRNIPGFDLRMEIYGWKPLVSNLLRNISLHLGAPGEKWNRKLYSGINDIHKKIGIDVNDSRTTFYGKKFRVVYAPQFETMAPAPVHIILTMILPLILLGSGKKRRWLLLGYLGIPVANFLLFCIILKWQPWHARLQLPVFCLAAPVIAAAFSGTPFRKTMGFLAGILAVAALTPSFQSQCKPLVSEKNIFNMSRDDLRYCQIPQWKAPQKEIIQLIKKVHAHSVHFDLAWEWQYPMMRNLLDTMNPPPRFWGTKYPQPSPSPDVLVIMGEGTGSLRFRSKLLPEVMRAVGKTQPFVCYIRESLVKKYKLENNLPDFIGWIDERGLRPRFSYLNNYSLKLREIVSEKVGLLFITNENGMDGELQGNVISDKQVYGSFSVSCNDQSVLMIHWKKGEAFRSFSVPLKAKKGKNVLRFDFSQIISEKEKQRHLFFSRLRILDKYKNNYGAASKKEKTP